MSRARTSPTRRGSIHEVPLSGVKPLPTNGAQNRASSAATVKSEASARFSPMPAAHPLTTLTIGTWVRSMRGMRRLAWAGRRRWMLPTRGLDPPAALRATMSNPEQKSGPAPVSTMARTSSSRPAASMASIVAATTSSFRALRRSGRSKVRRST